MWGGMWGGMWGYVRAMWKALGTAVVSILPLPPFPENHPFWRCYNYRKSIKNRSQKEGPKFLILQSQLRWRDVLKPTFWGSCFKPWLRFYFVRNTQLSSKTRGSGAVTGYILEPPREPVFGCVFIDFTISKDPEKNALPLIFWHWKSIPKWAPDRTSYLWQNTKNHWYLQWSGGFDGSFACFSLFLQWFWALHVY